MSERQPSYKICQALNIHDLEQQVIALKKKGFFTCGGMTCIAVRLHADKTKSLVFYQAMETVNEVRVYGI